MPQRMPVPPVDYTSKDWVTFRDDMENAISTRLPEWTSRSPNDFGIVLIELFAYVGDILSFYGDRIANEAFLPTAVLRSSVLSIARMLDYRPTGYIAAQVDLTFEIRAGFGAITIPAGTPVSTEPQTGDEPILFETDAELIIADSGARTGVVSATQGKTITDEALGQSNGALDQVFRLFYSPVIEESEIISVDEGSGPVVWQFYPNLIDAGPDDTAYTTITDENGILNIVFGDNVNGRVPANNAAVTATYRIGGGGRGNVGAGTLTYLPSQPANVLGVSNDDPAQGGADAESLDEIRENAPRSLTTIDRAVTLEDYANLAIKAGAAKAKAQAAVYTNVNLYIAPASGEGAVDPVASTALKTKIADYLAGRKMINATVTLLDPTYVDINVTTGSLHVLPQFNREVVRLDVEKAVREVLSYQNSYFGDRVTLSEIYRAILGVTGVDYATVSVLSRTASGLADVQLADNEIPSAGTINIDPLTTTGGITPV